MIPTGVFHDASNAWFWVLVGILTALGIALAWWVLRGVRMFFRWIGTRTLHAMQEALRVPLQQDVLPKLHAAALDSASATDTLGTKNGHGDLVEMVTLLLDDRAAMMAWQRRQDGDIRSLQDRLNA